MGHKNNRVKRKLQVHVVREPKSMSHLRRIESCLAERWVKINCVLRQLRSNVGLGSDGIGRITVNAHE